MPMQPSPGPDRRRTGPPPDRIARFEVRAVLGSGAFGVVYRAYDPQLEREVAIKVPKPGTLGTPKRVARFLGDAKAAAQLRHPHIVPVYDCGHDGDRIYIATAYVRGQTLAEAIDGPMDPRRAAAVVMKLAEALAYAHANGIVHRDVKPLNVMLDEHGEPHLIDFGLAQRGGDAERGRMILGTPSYMSPEQAAGDSGDAKPAFDQYALGVTLYELLTGRTPFSGPSKMQQFHAVNTPPPPPLAVNPDAPLDLALICLKALAKHPDNRYPDCAALAADLRAYLAGGVPTVRKLSPRERFKRWVRTEPKLAAAVGAVGLLVVLLAVVGVAFGAVSASKNRALAAAIRTAEENERKAREAEAQAVENARLAGVAKALADENARRATAGRAAATFDKAVAYGEQGEVGQCLTDLAGALELAEAAADGDLAAVVRQNLAGWRRQAHRLAAVRPVEVAPAWLVFDPREPDAVLLGGATGSGHHVLSSELNSRKPADGRFAAGHVPTRTAATDPVRTLLVTVSEDGEGRAFDTATGARVGELIRPPADTKFLSAAVFPGGDRVVFGADDGRAYTYARAGAEWVAGPVGSHSGGFAVRAVAVHPTGKWVLSGGASLLDGQVVVWSADDFAPVYKLPAAGGTLLPVTAVAFAPGDGVTFATGHGTLLNGEARVWDTATGAARPGGVLRHQSEVYAVAFSPDGRFLATASQDRSARVFDAATLAPVGQPLWHGRDVRAIAFSPDSRRLVTGGEEQALRVWELAPGPSAVPALRLDDAVLAAAPHPQTDRLFFGGLNTGRAWDPRDLREIPLPADGPGSVRPVLAAAYSPDGAHLMLGSRTDGAVLFDRAGARVRGFAHDGPVLTVAFHPDGKRFATGSDGVVRVYDRTAPDKPPVELPHSKDRTAARVYVVRFSPDGRHLFTGGTDRRGVLWDVATGKPLDGEMRHPDVVLAAAFAPDGRRIVTGYAGAALVWDWPLGGAPKEVGVLPHVPAGIVAVDVAPDGTVLTGGTDGTARWWDPKTRKPLGPMWRPGPTAKHVAFWPGGQRWMVSGTDLRAGQVLVIDKPPAVTEAAGDVVRWVRVSTGIGAELRVLSPPEWDAARGALPATREPRIEADVRSERAKPVAKWGGTHEPPAVVVAPGGANPEPPVVANPEAPAVAKPAEPPVSSVPGGVKPNPGDILEPFAGLDSGFDTLVRVRVRELLVNKQLNAWVGEQAATEPLKALLARTGMDPHKDVHEIAFVTRGKEPEKWAAVVAGRFNVAKLVLAKPTDKLTVERKGARGEKLKVTLADSGRVVWLALRGETVAAAGDEETLDKLLVPPKDRTKPPPPLALARKADPKAAVVAVLAAADGPHPLLAQGPNNWVKDLPTLNQAAAGVVVEITAAKDLDGVVRLTPRKDGANDLKDATEGVVAQLKDLIPVLANAELRAKGLGDFAGTLKVNVAPTGKEVVVTGKLTGDALEKLLEFTK